MGDNELYENIGFIKSKLESILEMIKKIESEGKESLEQEKKFILKEVEELRLKLNALRKDLDNSSLGNELGDQGITKRIRALEILVSKQEEAKIRMKMAILKFFKLFLKFTSWLCVVVIPAIFEKLIKNQNFINWLKHLMGM